MSGKKKETSVELVARETAEYCISIIPSLVDSLVKVNRETEIAALTITGNIRDMIWNSERQERGTSLSELLVSLQFQDVARQETEKVISSLNSLKERMEALKKHLPGDSELSYQPKEMKEGAAGSSEDSGESVVLFSDYKTGGTKRCQKLSLP